MPTTTPSELLVPGLSATRPQPLPFAPHLHVRAFTLHRGRGDLLVYSSEHVDRATTATRWYLGHWHEAMFAPAQAPEVPLLVHAADHAETEARAHARASFTRRHVLDEDFEVIPIPGHTPGSTAYLWDSGEHRVLFTADSLYLGAGGEWVGALLDSSDRASYLESLALLKTLDFDVLAPWAAPAGEPPVAHTDAADARRRLDAVIDRLWRGATH